VKNSGRGERDQTVGGVGWQKRLTGWQSVDDANDAMDSSEPGLAGVQEVCVSGYGSPWCRALCGCRQVSSSEAG
jgi:hypothetical protein